MTNLAPILILTISIITDLRNRKILNIVTLPAILIALAFHTITTGLDGFLFSGQGFLVGLGLLLIPFLMGGIGAGDVKLLAAIGALKGTVFVLYTGIYAGIIGGLIAIFILVKQRKLGFTLKHMLFSAVFLKGTKGSLQVPADKGNTLSIPYAVSIAIGAILTFLLETNL
ncbi:prepilin peptidase [Virgibacillus phasianinus]|uniref:Prepilin peptidase n=1 Tax=Virgibacillus phasianinus TaxID=2017483 RepID=A0A220U1B3_9BACI|nr:prepilin peptidase [Virgibacillus phasianinus]ASK61825.1 prepilin peptidase [Virgibacillus phasianinus]